MDVKLISYADNLEDVVLHRAFPAVDAGFYIDVGAYLPVDHSVTKHFYDRGWRGINIEPNPAPFARLRSERVRDINLNIGLSDRAGVLTVYEAPAACWSVDRDLLTGWFGARRDDLVARPVPVATLASICREYVPPGLTIDFLKVDVEGHERAVLEGGDWDRWRPRVVLVEANRPETWEPLLLSAGYAFALFDGVNRFYVREEDRRLLPAFAAPANASDQFLIYGYLKRIAELERQLAPFRELGPRALALAHWARRMSLKHPRLSAAVKPLLRRRAG